MFVKICGIRTLEAAKLAAENGADYIGVICVPNRKRTIDFDVAAQISAYLHSLPADGPKLVGVFRNQSLEDINAIKSRAGLDIVQLHGSETLEFAAQIDAPVIRRLVPGSPNFIEEVMKTAKLGTVLIDGEQGGDGQVVDWSVLGDVARAGGTYILAGGLTPVNVKEATAQPGCIGVDVSGGVEDANGDKEPALVKAFIAAVKK